MYWVIGAEVNRPLVWSLMFIWLEVRLCSMYCSCRWQRINLPLVSLFFTPLLSSGSPRDLFLNKVWDELFAQFYSPVIIQEFYWCSGKVWGERKCFIILTLGLSLLVSLYPWAVTFTTASQHLFFTLRWNRKARWGLELGDFLPPCGRLKGVRTNWVFGYFEPIWVFHFPKVDWALLNSFPWGQTLLRGRECSGHITKRLLSPPTSGSLREVFSDLHCENLAGLLVVKLKKVWGSP